MNDDFIKARDEFKKRHNFDLFENQSVGFNQGADWAYEWIMKQTRAYILTPEQSEDLKYKNKLTETEAKLSLATEALDFYTKHPNYWPVDENGHKLDEGASHVAKVALKKIKNGDNEK